MPAPWNASAIPTGELSASCIPASPIPRFALSIHSGYQLSAMSYELLVPSSPTPDL